MSDTTPSNHDPKQDPDSDHSALYASSRRETPPALLDANVMQAARAAIPDTKTPHRDRSMPWFAGLAASVVIGIVLVQLYPQTQHEEVIAQADLQSSSRLEAPAKEEAKAKQNSTLTPSVSTRAAAPAVKRSLSDQDSAANRAIVADSASTGLALSESADVAFTRIVDLYKVGKPDAAIKAYQVFVKQFPDYAAAESDQAVLKTLQEAVAGTSGPDSK